MATKKYSQKYICLIWVNIIFFIHTNAQWSDYYGGDGACCNVYFERRLSLIKQICVRDGIYIDTIYVQFSDNTWSQEVGGPGGAGPFCYEVDFEAGECFTSVTIRAGDFVDALEFTTSTGRTTPAWGENGGSQHIINGGPNQCISGMHVFYDDVVYRIAFYHVTTPNPTKAPTNIPSASTLAPTHIPTISPTDPTEEPTVDPTVVPTTEPSLVPTKSPFTPSPTINAHINLKPTPILIDNIENEKRLMTIIDVLIGTIVLLLVLFGFCFCTQRAQKGKTNLI